MCREPCDRSSQQRRQGAAPKGPSVSAANLSLLMFDCFSTWPRRYKRPEMPRAPGRLGSSSCRSGLAVPVRSEARRRKHPLTGDRSAASRTRSRSGGFSVPNYRRWPPRGGYATRSAARGTRSSAGSNEDGRGTEDPKRAAIGDPGNAGRVRCRRARADVNAGRGPSPGSARSHGNASRQR
jgi:hypothetical protein